MSRTLAVAALAGAASAAHPGARSMYAGLAGDTPASRVPWAYDWSRFPAAWFGSNSTDWESPAQIREIGRYSLAILGWQHLALKTDFKAVVYTQLAQAAVIKSAHPTLPVFVHASFGIAFGLNAAVAPLMKERVKYADFFLKNSIGPEMTRTNCEQMHTNDPNCVGWFWNFANASARDYFVEHLVLPLAAAPAISGVFFDAFNFAWDVPEVHPFGKTVANVPDCGSQGGVGCEALLAGALDVAKRTADLLNAHGKVPIFANPAAFDRGVIGNKIFLNESRLVDALEGGATPNAWLTYYEEARAEQVGNPANNAAILRNMLREGALGIGAGTHAYYTRDGNGTLESVTAHVAAFMLAREEHWYYFGSTGWFDSDWEWSGIYDWLRPCGRPVEPAHMTIKDVFMRRYTQCQVTLDCSHVRLVGGDCKARIIKGRSSIV